jgi:hypothetical protein
MEGIRMEEIYDRLNYAEWDESGFEIPEEYLLTDHNFLHEALNVFYAAGGYDFFKVVRPEKYADKWLDFIGNLHWEIYSGKYVSDGMVHENPLGGEKRKSLREQGVPDIFTRDSI